MSLPIIELVRWKYLYYASFGAFIIAVLGAYTGHSIIAIISLFSLLTWWLALPGMAIHYLKEVGVGDFFAVLLALHIGPLIPAVMSFGNIWSGLVFSRAEKFGVLLRVSITAFVATLSIPLLHSLSAGSTLKTLYFYSVTFYLILFVVTLLIARRAVFQVLQFIAIAIPLALITNTIYLTVFGDFSSWFASGSFSVNPLFYGTLGFLLSLPLIKDGVIRYVSRHSVRMNNANKNP